MPLRSGTSLWPAINTGPTAEANPWPGGERCDVAILGSGVTGALVGYLLAKSGVDTVLLDKRRLGEGSTAASTGLLQHEIDTPLCDLIKKVGAPHAVHAYRRGLQAIDEIEQLADDLGPSCGFTRRDSLYFASHFWHGRRLRREYDCRKSNGFAVEWWTRAKLRACTSLGAPCAIVSRGDGQVDPYQLTQSILRQAQRHGLRAYEHLDAETIDEDSHEVRIRTQLGDVTCRQIVYATGYDSHRYLDHDGSLHSTFAVASGPIDDFRGWPDGVLVWETARPYFYARQTADRRVIIGGADTMFSNDHQRDGLIERKALALERRFRRLFPAISFQRACAWAGTFGESKDGLAYIGRPSHRPRALFAIGYGGNGITFAMIAARLIADLYFGRPNLDAEVFRFGR